MSKPVVLFACIHNSGRSVAAQVLADLYGGDAIEVRSAGSEPGAAVNPVVAQVLSERGLSVHGHVPTKLDSHLVEQSDVVITMGCGETCPVFPGKRYDDWPVDDPAGRDLETVRRIVDDIDTRVRELVAELLAGAGRPQRVDSAASMEKAAAMATDEDIYSRIKALVDEEHSLAPGGSAERRQHLEEQLDQCWDLLRQRQARREFGEDPAAAEPRPVAEVEGYLQ